MFRALVLSLLISSLLGRIGISECSQFALCNKPFEGYDGNVISSAVYIAVPFHYQIKRYWCGQASLEMVFDYYGEDISQIEIADVARTERNGTRMDEMRRAAHFSNLSTSLGQEMEGNITGYLARSIGYAAFEQHNITIDDLKALINKEEPVIVLMWMTEAKSSGHYRVVVGYNETHMVMHDPWNKDAWGYPYGGANTSMTYSTFLALWEYEDYSGIWLHYGIWIHPWNIEMQVPSTVYKGDRFEVLANITYPCSPPFDAAYYPASFCNATIELSEGLELSLGETMQHSLGHVAARNSAQTSWSINATETGLHNISVTATGIVEGSVETHGPYPPYNYEDRIGGSCEDSIVFVAIRGDIDGDGDVDHDDLTVLAGAYGSKYPEDPTYHERADLDHDGDVDCHDLFQLAANYCTSTPLCSLTLRMLVSIQVFSRHEKKI